MKILPCFLCLDGQVSERTPVNGNKSCTLFSTRSESIAYLRGISASKISLRSLSGDYFKFLISIHSPDFLIFIAVFQQ
jgi:hypothetical protein